MTSEIERSEKRKKPRVRGYVVEEIWVELLQSRVSKMKQTIQGFIQVLRRKCYLGAMLSASILFPWALGILKKGGVVHVVLLVVVVVRDTAGRLSMRQQLDAAEMALASPSTARRSSRATSTSRPYSHPYTLLTPAAYTERNHGFISGAVQPTGGRGRGPIGARAAGAIQRHPRAVSQVCPATSRSGILHVLLYTV
jgi:hypothetical protein